VFTSIEYYTESAVVCIDGLINKFFTGNVTGAASGGILTKGTYGSIWAAYPYDANGTGNISGTQVVDAMVVVGTLDGKGVVGK
jgi:hypothetical protein